MGARLYRGYETLLFRFQILQGKMPVKSDAEKQIRMEALFAAFAKPSTKKPSGNQSQTEYCRTSNKSHPPCGIAKRVESS
jgi:hypothetical protein